MLWACLDFPRLPIETLERADPGASALAVTTGDTRPHVVAANAQASARGIRPGMSVTAALALLPELIVRPRDPRLETQALHGIAQWAEQFSPMLSLADPDAVLLEIGAGLELFGGLSALLASVAAAVPELGFTARLAAAPTPTGALMLARADSCVAITALSELEQALGCLSVKTLGCDESILETFEDLGVHRIAEILRLPRDGLARRFGQALVDTLDRALGRLADPRLPFIAPEHFSARLELPAPVWEAQALLFAARRLIVTLCGWLDGRGLGVMRLRFELVHDDCAPSKLTLSLSTPRRDPDHLCALLRERLERLELPDRVEAIVLAAEETAAAEPRSASLFPGSDPAEDAELCERLTARLGEDAVHALRVHADHRPEFAWRSTERPMKDDGAAPAAARPLWLLHEPRLLDAFLRDARAELALFDGPERIESGWWEGCDVRRDYFVARAGNGQTLWIFKGPGSGAAWYVHGIFA